VVGIPFEEFSVREGVIGDTELLIHFREVAVRDVITVLVARGYYPFKGVDEDEELRGECKQVLSELALKHTKFTENRVGLTNGGQHLLSSVVVVHLPFEGKLNSHNLCTSGQLYNIRGVGRKVCRIHRIGTLGFGEGDRGVHIFRDSDEHLFVTLFDLYREGCKAFGIANRLVVWH